MLKFQYCITPPRHRSSDNTASWLRGCWSGARPWRSAQCYEDTHCFYTCGYGYYQHAGMVKVVALGTASVKAPRLVPRRRPRGSLLGARLVSALGAAWPTLPRGSREAGNSRARPATASGVLELIAAS